jgi:Cdc6-like AAA superfamily ATPase
MRIAPRLFGRHRQEPVERKGPTRTEPDLSQASRRGPVMPPPGDERQVRHQVLRDAFTPTRPQRIFRRVAGRKAELLRVFRAIAQERAHVVLYGERGRGKTSLVNVVASAARTSGYMVARYACAADSDFDEIVRGLARDLPASLLAVPMSDDSQLEGCEAALPSSRLQPRDVTALPGRLSGSHLLLIVDEFDRVLDTATRTRLADTIKQVSDRGVSITFIVVGVSDSLDELLGRHPSIQRNIVGVPLPLLSDAEILDIIDLGCREGQLEFSESVRAGIVYLSRGVPYLAQLIGLHAGAAALARGARVVGESDLQEAIGQAAAEVDPRVIVVYDQMTRGERDTAMCDSLLAVACGKQDRFARFHAQEEGGRVHVAGTVIPAAHWARLLDSGAVRACPSAGIGMHTFTETMLPHYILLRSVLSRPLASEPTSVSAFV